MQEQEDIEEFSDTLALPFDKIEWRIAIQSLDQESSSLAGARLPRARHILGLHDLPHLVRDEKQIRILKMIIEYVTAMERYYDAYDVQWASPEDDAEGDTTKRIVVLPSSAKDGIYFKVIDANGKHTIDRTQLFKQGLAHKQRLVHDVEDFRKQLERSNPSHDLTESEKDDVRIAVAAIKNLLDEQAGTSQVNKDDLGNKLPDYLSRAGSVDRLTTTMKIESTLKNLLNNLQTYQFFICYLCLLSVKPRLAGRYPKELGLVLVGSVAVVESTLITTGVGSTTAMQAFNLLSSTAGGVTIALFVGRLESQQLRTPLSLILAIYAYAVLQMGWGIEPTNALAVVMNSFLFFAFAIFKLLLFLFILWLLDSGMLLHYFHHRFHTEQTLDHSISNFRKNVVPASEESPESAAE